MNEALESKTISTETQKDDESSLYSAPSFRNTDMALDNISESMGAWALEATALENNLNLIKKVCFEMHFRSSWDHLTWLELCLVVA